METEKLLFSILKKTASNTFLHFTRNYGTASFITKQVSLEVSSCISTEKTLNTLYFYILKIIFMIRKHAKEKSVAPY